MLRNFFTPCLSCKFLTGHHCFKTKENYEKAKEVVATMMEKNAALTTIVGLGVAAYIGFGLYNAAKGKSATTHIEAHNGAIVQMGGTMNVTESAIARIMRHVSDKKTLSKDAISAIAPARLEEGAAIVANASGMLTIPPEVIQEAPRDMEWPEPETQNEVLPKTDIEIWASDRESNTRSWAGIVPGRIDKRIRFVLDPAVHPDKVHGHRMVNADIVIVRQLDPAKKEFVPKRVEVLRVYGK